MVTINILQRTFHLRFGNSTGTAFTIEHENKQYFVTAKHVVASLLETDVVQIWHDGTWKNMNVSLVGHHNIADITVFVGEVYITAHPLPADSGGLMLGQDIYFLGFPHGLRSEAGEINRMFPLPLVKKACLSTLPSPQGDEVEGRFIFIDGSNTAGFSGGPVVFKEANSSYFKVCGVVHGYMTEMVQVEEIVTEASSRAIVRTNTGIMKAYCIDNAISLIRANPIGRENVSIDQG